MRKSELGFEVRARGEPSGASKTGMAVNSLRDLNNFAFTSPQKCEKKRDESTKKKVYQINLPNRLYSSQLPVNLQSLYNIGEEKEEEIKNFFKLNPIHKVNVKNRLGMESQGDTSNCRLEMEEELNNKVSNFLLNFQDFYP